MERKDKKYRGTKCLNCSTLLDVSEKFCAYCGQLNSTKKLTINDFIEEFFSNFYAYDSRLRNSILSIFTKPGALARAYNAGKRQTYANPFRLFLSVSILLFLTFSLNKEDNTLKKENELEKGLEIGLEHAQQPERLRQAKTDLIKSLKSTDKKRVQEIEYSNDSIYTKAFIDQNSNKNFDPFEYSITSFRNFHLKYPNKTTDQALEELGYENSFTYQTLFNKAKAFKSNHIYDELFDYFYEKLPFLIFISLPILTLMFWLVFYNKTINYTEHLVFSYTFFTFVFLVMLLVNFIELVSTDLANFIAAFSFLLVFPIYFYKSLRNFYEQSRWKTILKFILLNPLFILFLGICTVVMMFLGIILF